MKKVTSLLLLVGVAAFGLVACGDNVVPPDGGNVEGVTVTPSTLNIAVGGSGALSADVDGDPDNSVTWASNNASVATVDGDGNVTGVAEGNAVVTATSTVDDAHSASAEINVTATEEAEVSIASITKADGSPIDVDDVSGQINVTVNVSEGDQSVESVELLVDGEVASSQDFVSANLVEGAEAQGEVSQITFNFRTDRAPADAAMDGTPVEGEFQNGERVISAQLTLSSGDTNTATNSQTLNFNNQDRVVVSRLSGGQGIVGKGVRYWGGEDMTFAATAVLFSGRGVGSITLTPTSGLATANGGATMSFDAGTATSSPFQFAVIAADQGDVEDDPTDVGHSIAVSAMQDADGVNYALGSDIMAENMSEFFVDYTGPHGGGNVALELSDGSVDDPTAAAAFYSDGNSVVLPSIADAGVGGVTFQVDAVREGALTDTLFHDVSATDDLDERDPDAGSVSGTSGGYILDLNFMADALGNVGASADEPANSNDLGVDRGEPGFSDVLPASEFVFNGTGADADHSVLFTSEDVALATGDPGSGVDNPNVELIVTNNDSGDADTITVSGSAALTNPSGQDFQFDPDAALPNTGGVDGSYTVAAMSPDNALLANTGATSLSYILDTTPPSFGALDPAPQGSSGTQATSIVMDIGGTVTDANELVAAQIDVRVDGTDAQGTTSDGICDTGDYLLDVDAGEISQNEVDITDGTNEIAFNESFEVADPLPSASGTVTYCFFVTAEDGALLNDGATPDHNGASLNSQADVVWQN